jgi:hypothetical protein
MVLRGADFDYFVWEMAPTFGKQNNSDNHQLAVKTMADNGKYRQTNYIKMAFDAKLRIPRIIGRHSVSWFSTYKYG